MANYQNSPVKQTAFDKNSKIGIAVSKWNSEITEALYSGAINFLIKAGIDKSNIEKVVVPGSFELSLASQKLAQRTDISGVIVLGCVIQGETRHFDFICNAVANGVTNVALKYDKPVIFGVLTPNNQKQAMERAGGKYGNKGEEAAYSLLQML